MIDQNLLDAVKSYMAGQERERAHGRGHPGAAAGLARPSHAQGRRLWLLPGANTVGGCWRRRPA